MRRHHRVKEGTVRGEVWEEGEAGGKEKVGREKRKEEVEESGRKKK